MTAPGGLISGEEPGCTQMGILVSGLPCADATWSDVLCFTPNLEDQRLIQNLRCDFCLSEPIQDGDAAAAE